MKKLLPLFIVALFYQSHSQSLVLTQAAFEPSVGDTSRHYIVDTSNYTGGLNVGLSGANTVWTYVDLLASGNIVTSAYLTPSAVPNATDYPGCTIVQKTGGLNTYYSSVTSPSVQMEFMGVSSSSLNMNFTNTAVSSRYPFAFGDSFTDNFGGSFTFSLSGSATGNATVTADGSGTLNLPGGVYNNVLRVKSVQNTTLNAGFITGTIKQTLYSWYHTSEKYPVMSINYQTITITGMSPTITAQVLGNKNNWVIGLQENFSHQVNASIYPNPVNDVLNISTDNADPVIEITIYNQLGQNVLSAGSENTIKTESLQNGIYIAEVRTKKGLCRKKFIKD